MTAAELAEVVRENGEAFDVAHNTRACRAAGARIKQPGRTTELTFPMRAAILTKKFVTLCGDQCLEST